ncbi:AAEL013288-PB [Aedes aegypti]|uniref:AAEL013288-PB n=1 Tax=Aedes aegypti TaxID=7159 RepID=Q16JK8_AEDAE|nr:AAEL013288-PB [Aedes aegypti]
MDTFADYVSQHTTRSVGSENGNTTRGSPNQTSLFESDQDHVKCSFKPWVMITLLSLHWIASWAITITGIVLIFKPFDDLVPCHLFYLIVYLRVGYWFGAYKLNEAIKDSCRKLVHENYELYESLTIYRKAPLQIVSFWNTALFAVLGYAKSLFVQNGTATLKGPCQHPFDNDLLDALRSPQMVIVIFCAIESLVLSCFYMIAFSKLHLPILAIT